MKNVIYQSEQRSVSDAKKPFDPFYGFFKNNQLHQPEKGSLSDVRSAQRWYSIIGQMMEDDVYTNQQPMASKSGPKVTIDGREMYMLSSYDYLGLIGHPAIEQAAIDAIRKYGTGTGGVRLLTGTNELHRELENEIAAFKGTESALVLTSGYMANLAVISALMSKQDCVIVDAYIHRSVVDALQLAGISFHRFVHNDPSSLEDVIKTKGAGKKVFVIIEGTYSMDGDVSPLPEIVEVKNKYGAFLMVDECHSFGNLGEFGRGVDEFYGISPDEIDIWTCSLSKTVPANGGFIAGKQEMMIYLQHGAAPYMFSAALCPSATAAALESLRVIQREPERIAKLNRNAAYLRNGLQLLGYNVGHSITPVIPVITGDNEKLFRLSKQLYEMDILATCVIYPAVPPGASRLRLCATAAQDMDMLNYILAAFRKCSEEENKMIFVD
jgi:8-amino-7-oxononanoate synthase